MKVVQFKHETAAASTGFVFWQVSMLWQRAIVSALKPYDLTHAQFVLLAGTGWLMKMSSDSITQVALAAQAKTDIMMTSKVVRTLVGKNLLQRIDHPADSRAYALRLTSAGVKLLQGALQSVEEADEQFFADLRVPASFRKELLNLIKNNTKE